MPFIHTYNAAVRQLQSINNKNCTGRCRQIWLKNIKYALKSKKNPLHLNKSQKKSLRKHIGGLTKKSRKTQKKYKDRKSPPYSANDYCGKSKTGNDGRLYKSTKNKNNVCTWKIKKPNTKFFRPV